MINRGSSVQTNMLDLRNLDRARANWKVPRITQQLNQLRLWPLRGICAWWGIAVLGWLAATLIAYILVGWRPSWSFTSDNFRYFHSAVAQSIAALGALVFVASFAILQMHS